MLNVGQAMVSTQHIIRGRRLAINRTRASRRVAARVKTAQTGRQLAQVEARAQAWTDRLHAGAHQLAMQISGKRRGPKRRRRCRPAALIASAAEAEARAP
eukprot:7780752-Pyramimonas_sp.AAC.1